MAKEGAYSGNLRLTVPTAPTLGYLTLSLWLWVPALMYIDSYMDTDKNLKHKIEIFF